MWILSIYSIILSKNYKFTKGKLWVMTIYFQTKYHVDYISPNHRPNNINIVENPFMNCWF